MPLRSVFRASRFRRLVRNWLAQGVTWYALTEVVARLILEGGFVLALLVLGVAPAIVIVAWIAFHTVAWVFLYGGFMILWKVVLRAETEMPRLRASIDRIAAKVSGKPFLRLVLLRGSAARGDLGVHSDIDVLGVPERGLRAKARAIAFWWGLRAGAALRRVPLEARWVDSERFVPYHVLGETPIFLKRARPAPSPADRLASRGILVCFSGIDGSGKTTVAHQLVSTLKRRGFHAVYFYGHRQGWYELGNGNSFSWGIGLESIWKRIGRKREDFERYPAGKFVYDALTFLDYFAVLWRLSGVLAPQTIVVTDRYVADVIAYLRVWGRLRNTLEGLLLAASFEPDAAILLEIDPSLAIRRKREWNLPRLRGFADQYSELKELLNLTPIDAARPLHEVVHDVERVLEREHVLALPRP